MLPELDLVFVKRTDTFRDANVSDEQLHLDPDCAEARRLQRRLEGGS